MKKADTKSGSPPIKLLLTIFARVVTAFLLFSAFSAEVGVAQYVTDELIASEDTGPDDLFGSATVKIDAQSGQTTLAIGAPGSTNPSNNRIDGRVYVVRQSDGQNLFTISSPNSTNGGEFGAAVGVVGDLTGDQFPELIIGAPDEDPPASPVEQAGNAYLFDGSTGALIRRLQTESSDIELGRRFGETVTGIGDVNGDGSPDIVVGAPSQTDGRGTAGAVYIFNGADGSVIQKISGAGVNLGRFGASLTSTSDLVGSSSPDLVVGAPGEGTGGRVYIIDGTTIGSASIDETIIASGNPEIGGAFGAAVGTVGAGSNQDLIVGAPAEDGGGELDAGRTYIVDGSDLTATPLAIRSGSSEQAGSFGRSVAGIEDVNNDGEPDVIVGAPRESANGIEDAGRAYVVNPATGTILDVLTSITPDFNGRFGTRVLGTPRPVVSAPQEAVGSIQQAGRVQTFRIPNVAFTDGRAGEAFEPTPASPGDPNVPLGRFELSSDDSRSELASVSVTNEGTSVTDVQTIELWSSSDNVFSPSSDTKLSEKNYSSTSSFSGLDVQIPTEGLYFFVVVDLGSSPSGEYDPAITSDADIGITDGQIASVNGQDATTFSVGNGRGFLSVGPTAPLPVELAAFDADVTNDRSVRLQWQTTSETGNSGFRVQRSVSGTSWSTLGRVEGAGTTDEPQSYRFTDSSVPYASDSLQYRLAQVDVDGTVNVSDPVTVRFGNPDGLELLGSFPNPARSQATVRFAVPEQTTGDVQLELYDLLGRQVKTIPAAEASGRVEQTLDVSDLPSGTYLLRLSAGGQTQTQQVTIVR